jgi:NAD(P)-dependent dehydrogenase (short-subunit alcohol dehydrogenase family)
LRLAADGLAVAVAARSRDQVDDTARAAGARALALMLDVTDAASIAAALERIHRELGPVDVLVNNAGVAESAQFVKTEPDFWDRHFAVNVRGPYLLTRAVLPGMLERRWGRVINIASLAGLFGSPYVTAYTASKHALVGFTRALATEVSGKGVTVNALCPGFTATDIVWNGARNIVARTGKSFDDAVKALAEMNPGRRLIEPDEVADAAAKLVADDMTNGDTIVIDGSAPAAKGVTR